ncbi:hypothetical protein [Pontibacter pamirensis]|uniref:hypothetical protein n=1 Tax=Pontibacter pamirensis TaxID=2562824 RepID=UPI00138A2B0B|nr:hypothetical protein [Pontibacter pamirensis]
MELEARRSLATQVPFLELVDSFTDAFKMLDRWAAYDNNVTMEFSRPGKRADNAYSAAAAAF